MKRIGIVVLFGLLVASAPARAAVTFEYILSGGYPLHITPDGQTVAGNTTSYGAFRWTASGGLVPLGMDATPSPGGTPGISDDGTKVAATIASADTTYAAAGLWTLGTGWSQCMPPGPSDIGIVDRTQSDTYGLSGDGSTVVGLYWRPGLRAHAFRWTQAGGGVDLGSKYAGHASRANGVNQDGSLVCGWDEAPFGNWSPAAWLNGVEHVFGDSTTDGQCQASNPAGTILVGFEQNPANTTRELAMWTRTGTTWGTTQFLGALPGTEAGGYGINIGNGVTADGSMVVGYCSYDGSPYSPAGFVWTPQTGIEDVVTWLGDHGVAVDQSFYVFSLTGITPDGQWIIGFGRDILAPYATRGFRIHNTDIAAVTPATQAPRTLALAAPSPNPSRGTATLVFTLPRQGAAELAVFDPSGRRVATPANADFAAGPHTVTWNGRADDGRPLPAGLYFARLVTAQGTLSRRLVRIR